MSTNVLVTGGCGFIGSNLVRFLLRERPDWKVVNLDLLTYAGNLENLAGLEDDARHVFVHGDVGDRACVDRVLREHAIDAVLHLAAESHVDRSIEGPAVFVTTNVLGTQHLLEACRARGVRRFVQVSTDEVYGSLGPSGAFTERSPLQPSSPYSASKTGADLLALAYHHTYGMDVVVTRCSNNYGRYQFPEKLIPRMVVNALRDQPLPVYGDGQHVRDWLHVDDHCLGLLRALERGTAGEVYNLGGGAERRNLDLVKGILAELGKPESLLQFVTDRLGHDRRYAIDPTKSRRELGWAPTHSFEQGLSDTVRWYVEHPEWWGRVLSREYRNTVALASRRHGA
ncbi:dTDP-glucose 4,6-dehydratase [Corallococcus sp. Z5C101001]|uniref:dTDP-glucose 4,6-dehydratase n=1 Tax=Corallococcus sp. Z5C101001 TaxID=2596829 RepID=UPI00117E6507|nr:dTDP-glucose 4,6-dehydratase [Corallococcus sp. Z5C101001]TSC31422.1 dTDP-glucose 4,6-dehydratase [Corallococcus sp. Z5C101001]